VSPQCYPDILVLLDVIFNVVFHIVQNRRREIGVWYRLLILGDVIILGRKVARGFGVLNSHSSLVFKPQIIGIQMGDFISPSLCQSLRLSLVGAGLQPEYWGNVGPTVCGFSIRAVLDVARSSR
jgi:hypothetical protein